MEVLDPSRSLIKTPLGTSPATPAASSFSVAQQGIQMARQPPSDQRAQDFLDRRLPSKQQLGFHHLGKRPLFLSTINCFLKTARALFHVHGRSRPADEMQSDSLAVQRVRRCYNRLQSRLPTEPPMIT